MKILFSPFTLHLVPLILCLLSSCQNPPQEKETAFYYWQSGFTLSDSLQYLLQDQKVDRLFVKFMDIDLVNGEATPVAPIQFNDSSYQHYELVPCVFITNRTFTSERVQPQQLAEKVWDYLAQIRNKYHLNITEYQFDCDWTPSTRQAYFAFLETINRLKGEALLSSTLRLHQYRYPEQTGVPPVDKVVLMYYNMGDIEDVEESNSILNNEKGEAYLTKKQAYPLKLDVALPLFSWTLVYRLGKLEAILKTESPSMPGIEKTGKNTFVVKQNLYFGGHYLNQGDFLRYEMPTPPELERAARAVSEIKNRSGTLLFYHLEEALPQYYPSALLHRLDSIYHH
jgi:hypothetical protein